MVLKQFLILANDYVHVISIDNIFSNSFSAGINLTWCHIIILNGFKRLFS